jgi:flavin-dependent dehydrogenase
MEGVACPYPPSSWISIAYPSLSPFINIWLGPMADGTWQVGTSEKVPASPVDIMHRFLTASSYAPWFKNARIVHKTACSITPRYPIADPVSGSIMVIGDAAAPAETWTQGAIASAYQAVTAISKGTTGDYKAWWQESFYFNSPQYYQDLARYPALNMFFNDEEIDYLYGLIPDALVPTVMSGILKNADRIKAEKPGIYEKLKKIPAVSLDETFAGK